MTVTTAVDSAQSAGYWQVVKAEEGTNYCTNPSAELDTAGWTANNATLSRLVGGYRGAYSFQLTASAASNRYAAYTYDFNGVAPGTALVVSAYVFALSPLVKLVVEHSSGQSAEIAHPGDTAWHRLEIGLDQASFTFVDPFTVKIVDGRTGVGDSAWFDAVQIEVFGTTTVDAYGLVPTTYFDGDEPGCLWDAGPHRSLSRRRALAGENGRIFSLDSLGLYVLSDGPKGIGLPKLDLATQAYAFGDGAAYQRTVAEPRVISLLCRLLDKAGYSALHTARRAVVDVLTPDARAGRGPVLLRYVGGSDPRVIGAVYEGGLELEAFEPPNETVPLRFLAPDPFWRGERDVTTNLDPADTLTNTNMLAQRKHDGTWTNLSSTLTSPIAQDVRTLALHPDGRLIVGGDWTGALASGDHLASWDGSSWSLIGGVDPDGAVLRAIVSPAEHIVIGGQFLNVGATAAVRIAAYDGSSWAAIGSGANGNVLALVYDNNGFLWAGGDFTTIGGVASTYAGYWNGSSWQAAALSANCWDLKLGPDGRVYAATDSGVHVWNGSSWTAIGAANGSCRALAWGPDGRLYVGGYFTTIGGVSANYIARWNGTIWEPLGSGLSAANVAALAIDAAGRVYAAGGNFTTAGGVPLADPIAVWNGATWHPVDVDFPNTGGAGNFCGALLIHPNGALTAGWDGAGTATVPGIATVNNAGTAVAYPVIRIAGSGGYHYSLVNLTTGQEIRFSGLALGAAERAVLDLRPGKKTFASQFRNLLGSILPGSDVSTWGLVPGANRVAYFSTASSPTAVLTYRPRYWSAD